MLSENKPIEVTICLGSSCFARGNAENLDVLKKFEESHTGSIRLHLTGSLCQEHCKQGPNLKIGGHTLSGVTPAQLRAYLQRFAAPARDHGVS